MYFKDQVFDQEFDYLLLKIKPSGSFKIIQVANILTIVKSLQLLSPIWIRLWDSSNGIP